jgi:hypothetical protein
MNGGALHGKVQLGVRLVRELSRGSGECVVQVVELGSVQVVGWGYRWWVQTIFFSGTQLTKVMFSVRILNPFQGKLAKLSSFWRFFPFFG